MSEPLILDAGPLGKIAHPKPNKEVAKVLIGILGSGIKIYLPEIADYEVRRSFILHGLSASAASPFKEIWGREKRRERGLKRRPGADG